MENKCPRCESNNTVITGTELKRDKTGNIIGKYTNYFCRNCNNTWKKENK